MPGDDSDDSRDILRLNDYCLYEIYNHLPVNAWCSLRQTCTRLQTISDYCFKREHSSFILDAYHVTGSRYSLGLKMKDVRFLFQSFGHLLTQLTINKRAFYPDEDIGQLILLLDQHCISLQNLKLVNIEFDASVCERSDALFSNLERLVMEKYNGCCATTFLPHCRGLKELEIIRFANTWGVELQQHIDTLESLSIKSYYDSTYNFDYSLIRKLVVDNPQLKELKLIGVHEVRRRYFKHISDNLPNLEALSLAPNAVDENVNESLMYLLRLTKLKKLEIMCGFEISSFLNKLAARNQIQTLLLSNFKITKESIQALCNFETLNVLKITETKLLDSKTCKKLASELPVLSEIHIIECYSTSINELNEFAKHSSALKKLVFVRYDYGIPSLTKHTYLALIQARRQNSNDEKLDVFLEYDDYCEVKNDFLWQGITNILANQSHIINVLPLEAEVDKLPLYEFGSGKRRGFMGSFETVDGDFYDVLEDQDFDEDDYYDGLIEN